MKSNTLKTKVILVSLSIFLTTTGGAQEVDCPGKPGVTASCTEEGGLVKKWVCTTPSSRGVAKYREEAQRKACSSAQSLQ